MGPSFRIECFYTDYTVILNATVFNRLSQVRNTVSEWGDTDLANLILMSKIMDWYSVGGDMFVIYFLKTCGMR